MKYLYKNEDGFVVERKLGMTWYYCDVLKTAIKTYALSKTPDYEELQRIVRRIDTYMESSRYIGKLGAPIYVQDEFAADIRQIRSIILNMKRATMSEEQLNKFFKTQIERINYATERKKSLLWSS
jgi:hypothetical protein